jgi:DUF1680 family protein
VTVRITRTDGGTWPLTLRVPRWADGAVLVTAGGRRTVPVGDLVVRRDFVVGEEIRLELPMRPRFTRPDPRIDAVRGCVAVERGPIVFCAESVGESGDLDALRVEVTAQPADADGEVAVRAWFDVPAEAPWPYGAGEPALSTDTALLHLVPYHRWARRGPSTMRVWLPTT